MPSRPVVTVLCADDRPQGMAPVEQAAEVRYVQADGLAEALADADVLFMWDFFSPALREAWPAARKLQWIHAGSAGVDAMLFDGVRQSDVVLTNSRGVFDTAIAEYVLAVVLAYAKDLPHTLELQRERRWLWRETEGLNGRNALVVGTGPIGAAIARMLRAVGLNVRGAGRTARADDPEFGVVHASAELVQHVGWADFVVLVAPLTEQTRGLFDRKVFAAMRPSARFVNVGRGELVVQDDLIAALQAGELAGAALDVFETEPLPPESPLWTMPNVIVSPHMSGDTVGWKNTLAEVFVANFARWNAGEPLQNVVDKDRGYVPTGEAR